MTESENTIWIKILSIHTNVVDKKSLNDDSEMKLEKISYTIVS